jgi:hypothetical protein
MALAGESHETQQGADRTAHPAADAQMPLEGKS